MWPPQAPATDIAAVSLHSTADLEIDVTAEVCPMTYVRTRLALDRLRAGQVLGVTLRGEEAARNVPATAVEQGHAVLGIVPGSGVVRVIIRKK